MGGPVTGPCVADLERALATAFPPERAEPWDRVGLVVGDPDAQVMGVAFALDPTVEAVHEAAERGANVLVTHHPAFLEPLRAVAPGAGGGGDVVYAAVAAGVALIAAHTNLDRDPRAQALLPQALGLAVVGPVEREPEPTALVTVYVPPEHSERVRTAMAEAGAGRIGAYERCAFISRGTGRFVPEDAAHPFVGRPGADTAAEEERVEMVCPLWALRGVLEAAARAHPYEEPLIIASEVHRIRNRAALGALARPENGRGTTVGELAERAARSFGVVPRVWGAPERPVARIATATGSAGSLIGDVVKAGADVLVAGEVRYHDALRALGAGLAVIELGHDVSELPLVDLLEEAILTAVPNVPHVRVCERRSWWMPAIGEGIRDGSHPG